MKKKLFLGTVVLAFALGFILLIFVLPASASPTPPPTPTPSPSPSPSPTPTCTTACGPTPTLEFQYNIYRGNITLSVTLDDTNLYTQTQPMYDGVVNISISPTVINNTRTFVMKGGSLNHTPVFFPDLVTGTYMDFALTLMLEGDSVGTLYVNDSVGDVDVFTETTCLGTPQTVTTIGDGTADVAGSELSPVALNGSANVSQFGSPLFTIYLPLAGNMTTNYSQNHMIDDNNPSNVINDSTVSGWGIPFEQSGGPYDYVGTNGKLVMTAGAFDATDAFVDFQAVIELWLCQDGNCPTPTYVLCVGQDESCCDVNVVGYGIVEAGTWWDFWGIPENTVINVSASFNPYCNTFNGWTGDVANSSAMNTTITMDMTKCISASCSPYPWATPTISPTPSPTPSPSPSATPTPTICVTEFPICNNSSDQSYPDVSGDIVVWQDNRNGNWDIYGCNLSAHTEFPICTNSYDQIYPAISGDFVVWQDWRDNEYLGWIDIYGYNLKSHYLYPICTTAWDYSPPDISGNIVVWMDQRDWFSNGNDIYGYNLSSYGEIPICVDTHDVYNPAVSGDIVVWEDYDLEDIYGYNLSSSTKFPICADYGNYTNWQDLPAVSGDIVVFMEMYVYDICGYNLHSSTKFPICIENTSEQRDPAISGNIVAWKDNRNGNDDIYGYNMFFSTEFPVCINLSHQQYPAVDGDTVVWQDNRNGNWDIYGATLGWPTPTPTPTVSSTASPSPSPTPSPSASPSPSPTATPGPGDVNGDFRINCLDITQTELCILYPGLYPKENYPGWDANEDDEGPNAGDILAVELRILELWPPPP